MNVNALKTFLKISAREIKKGNFKILENTRFYTKWKASFTEPEKNILRDLPWLTFLSIEFLHSYIKPGFKVFEYGGGASTQYFCRKECEVYTTENNADWFSVLTQIADQNKFNWKGELIQGEPIDNFTLLDASNPHHYYTTDESSLKNKFEKYAASIDKFENDFFDIVLVDGRSRPSCIMHAIPKIKKGGLLILDNSERSYYLKMTQEIIDKEFILKINRLGLVPNLTHFSETTIWIKTTGC